MDDVDIYKEDLDYIFLDDNKIQDYVKTIIDIIKRELNYTIDFTLSITFVNKAKIQELNFDYRNVNYPTDVLSFPQEQSFILPINLLGDIIVCLSFVKASASELKISFEEEFSRVMIHGILHLFGYTHNSNDFEKEKMLKFQEEILSRVGNVF